MPKFRAQTSQAELKWTSDDGQVKRYDVAMLVNGKTFKTQTYSDKIATQGWEGEVETYEKNNYTYVRQPKKEDQGSYRGGGGGRGSEPKDTHTMYTSYAKDIAVALLETSSYKKATLDAVIQDVIDGGNTLHAARPGATPSAPAASAVNNVFPDAEVVGNDVVAEVDLNEELTLDDLPNL